MTVPPATWHRVDVTVSAALARTRVTLLGALDNPAIALIDDAIELAEANDHTLTFDLSQMCSITPDALAVLLARGAGPSRATPDASTTAIHASQGRSPRR